ncbi:MAG TPA: hypothetical protein VGK34_06625 [Armatimonadota bacterium]|jgi:hypothetical protein
MWRSVVAAVAEVAAGIAIWIVTINAAWNIGSWVEASTPIPIMAVRVAFSPTIIEMVLGVLCTSYGIRRRARVLLTVGITALIMAGFLFMLTRWSLTVHYIA